MSGAITADRTARTVASIRAAAERTRAAKKKKCKCGAPAVEWFRGKAICAACLCPDDDLDIEDHMTRPSNMARAQEESSPMDREHSGDCFAGFKRGLDRAIGDNGIKTVNRHNQRRAK